MIRNNTAKVRAWAEQKLWRRRLVVLVAVPLFLPLTFVEYVGIAIGDWFERWRDLWPEVVSFWRGET